MSDKQTKRKYLVQLTESTDYTVVVWARDAIDAARVAEEDFDYLIENGERDGSSIDVECLDDLSQNPTARKRKPTTSTAASGLLSNRRRPSNDPLPLLLRRPCPCLHLWLVSWRSMVQERNRTQV